MATDKQLAANRKNGKLGGPKTDKGKAVSRFNALKHGLTAKEVVIRGEDKKLFDLFKNEMWEDLNPQGALERFQADLVALDAWRVRRSLIAETKYLNADPIDEDEEIEKDKEIEGLDLIIHDFETIQRYEKDHRHKFDKSLEQFQKIQQKHCDRPLSPPKTYINTLLQTNVGVVAACTFVHHPGIIYL